MPCYATGSAQGDAELSAREAHEELTRVTRVACELREYLRQQHLGIGDLSRETQRWILKHDEIDRERIHQKAVERDQRELRKKGLAKLTANERKALKLYEPL